jgi:hypothetical protein
MRTGIAGNRYHVDGIIVHAVMRQNARQALLDAATAYKVDTDAITLKSDFSQTIRDALHQEYSTRKNIEFLLVFTKALRLS